MVKCQFCGALRDDVKLMKQPESDVCAYLCAPCVQSVNVDRELAGADKLVQVEAHA